MFESVGVVEGDGGVKGGSEEGVVVRRGERNNRGGN